MIFRRRSIQWPDLVLIALAFPVVYPDKVAEWLADYTGIEPGWLTILLIEIAAFALIALAMFLIMPIRPNLEWWHPIIHIGIVGLIRAVHALVTSWFGFGD